MKKDHALYSTFFRRLRDAIFISNTDDVELVESVLREKGLTEQEIRKKMNRSTNYYKKRVRRVVPGPDELTEAIQEVVNVLGDAVDDTTGFALFNTRAYNQLKNVLNHVKKGCVSDKPGISLYILQRTDKDGIPVYRCSRGTSALESLHAHIRRALRGYRYTPRVAIAILREFYHRWNVEAENALFEKGNEYTHFFNTEVFEEMQRTYPNGKLLFAFFLLLS